MFSLNCAKWSTTAIFGTAIIVLSSILANGAGNDNQDPFKKTWQQAEKLEKKNDLAGAIKRYQTLLSQSDDEELKQRVSQRILQIQARLRIINAVVKYVQESGSIEMTKTGRRGLEGTITEADSKRFTLKFEGAQMKLSWSRLRGRSLYDLGTKSMDLYSGQAHFDLAMQCLSQDIPDLAEQEFEKAVSLEPSLEEVAKPYRQPLEDAAKEEEEVVASADADTNDDDEDEDEVEEEEEPEAEELTIADFGWKEAYGDWTVDENGIIEGTGGYGMITAGNSDWRDYTFSFTGQLMEGSEMILYARANRSALQAGAASPGFGVSISDKEVYALAAWEEGGQVWYWRGTDTKRRFKGGRVHKYTVKVKGGSFKVYADGNNIMTKSESRIKYGIAGIGFIDGTIKIRNLKIKRFK